MAAIRPFKRLYYSDKENREACVAPPYDVISPEARTALIANDRHNIANIIVPEDDGHYEGAATLFRGWIRDNILVQETDPCLYLLKETFVTATGGELVRRGIICEVELPKGDSMEIQRHEKTFDGPKADRLRLISACQANLSAIFGMYNDPQRQIERAAEKIERAVPDLHITVDEVRQELWAVRDPQFIELAQEVIGESELIIADGHHRYETALTYRDQQREKAGDPPGYFPHDGTMFYLANMSGEGVAIMPYHRLITGDFDLDSFSALLDDYFIVEQLDGKVAIPEVESALEHAGTTSTAFALYTGKDGWKIVRIKDVSAVEAALAEHGSEVLRTLDVTVLHFFLLARLMGLKPNNKTTEERIEYTVDLKAAVQRVDMGKASLVCALNSTKASQVRAVAALGETMPHKSTYFYPKLVTGLAIRDLS